MIVPGDFYDVLGKNARLNRMNSNTIGRINRRHSKMEGSIEDLGVRLNGSSILEYIQERVRVEISFRMHDEGIRYIRFSEKECPLSYELIAKGRIPIMVEDE